MEEGDGEGITVAWRREVEEGDGERMTCLLSQGSRE